MSAISGQKTIATAGTALVLGSQMIHGPLMLKALDANTGYVYIGNDGAGDVTNANGLEMAAGDVVVFDHVGSLASIIVDVSVNGEKVAWLMLNV
jgi:hypothetical protein